MIFVLWLFYMFCSASAKAPTYDKHYCELVPEIPEEYAKCFDSTAGPGCNTWVDADMQLLDYEWSNADKYYDDCKSHKICCQTEAKEREISENVRYKYVTCKIEKICEWLLPNLKWLIPVVAGVIGLIIVGVIISCCCCGGKKKKPERPKSTRRKNDDAEMQPTQQPAPIVVVVQGGAAAAAPVAGVAAASATGGYETSPGGYETTAPATDPAWSKPAADTDAPEAEAPAADAQPQVEAEGEVEE